MRKNIHRYRQTKTQFRQIDPPKNWWKAHFFDIVNTITALFIGGIGIYLAMQANTMNKRMLGISLKQDSTSLDVQHFNQLLIKTDSLIEKQSEIIQGLGNVYQTGNSLWLNKEQNDRIASIGDMNILYAKAYQINAYFFTSFLSGYRNFYDQLNVEVLTIKQKQLDTISKMFLEQSGNYFLNKNVELQKRWRLAYGTTTNAAFTLKHEIDFYGSKVYYQDKGTYGFYSIDSSRIDKLLWECIDAINGAVHPVMDTIRKNRVEMGFDDKNFNPIIKRPKR